MKTFTINDIRSWTPCYNPNRFLPEDWKGTAIDILNNDQIPFQDRLWVVLRTKLISEKTMRLFAVWSYRQTLKFIRSPDLRSVEAANVAEKFANGLATESELSAAWSAAWSAARSAESAARSASWSARSAAWSAAESASEAAYSSAWSSTISAAEIGARSEAEVAQKNKLIEMILEENKSE